MSKVIDSKKVAAKLLFKIESLLEEQRMQDAKVLNAGITSAVLRKGLSNGKQSRRKELDNACSRVTAISLCSRKSKRLQ